MKRLGTLLLASLAIFCLHAQNGWPVFSGDSGESWFALDPTQYLRREGR